MRRITSCQHLAMRRQRWIARWRMASLTGLSSPQPRQWSSRLAERFLSLGEDTDASAFSAFPLDWLLINGVPWDWQADDGGLGWKQWLHADCRNHIQQRVSTVLDFVKPEVDWMITVELSLQRNFVADEGRNSARQLFWLADSGINMSHRLVQRRGDQRPFQKPCSHGNSLLPSFLAAESPCWDYEFKKFSAYRGRLQCIPLSQHNFAKLSLRPFTYAVNPFPHRVEIESKFRVSLLCRLTPTTLW